MMLSKLATLCPKIIIPKSYTNIYGLKHHPYSSLLVRGLGCYQNSAKPSFALKNYRPILCFIGFGNVFTLVFGPETIPYTERRHIVLVPPKIEKWIGDKHVNEKISSTSILPENHPYSVRVRSISNRLIEALETDLQIQRRNFVDPKKTVKEPLRRRNNYYVKHLEGLDWEVIVVSRSSHEAYCLPGGKIVMFSGFLRSLESDEEIATIIGHEIGHIVARHSTAGFINTLKVMMVVLANIAGVNSGKQSTRNNHTIKLLKSFWNNSLSQSVVFGLETIPYSNRRYIVFVPPKNDKVIGDNYLKKKKLSILPDKHPYSIRVRSISNQIIEALETDLQIQRRNFSNNISNVDDKEIVKESRRRQNKYSVKHLEGLDWEVMVVEKSSVNAYCLPGGKIVVYTGLVDRFKSDGEIATIIGHEVRHIVARHAADRLTKSLIAMVVALFIVVMAYSNGQLVGNSDWIGKLINFLLERPWSRRLEKEADYIGLLLMATAGYDPQNAPRVYEMLDEKSGNESRTDFFSTHPSGKKRAKALLRDRVMNEASSRYARAIEFRKNNIKDLTI